MQPMRTPKAKENNSSWTQGKKLVDINKAGLDLEKSPLAKSAPSRIVGLSCKSLMDK